MIRLIDFEVRWISQILRLGDQWCSRVRRIRPWSTNVVNVTDGSGKGIAVFIR